MDSSPFELSFSDDITVHEVASQIKTFALSQMTESEFSQRLLFMDKIIKGDLEKIITILSRNPTTSHDFQLAICWLDGNGYGGTPFAQLQAGLLMKQSYNNDMKQPPSLN